MNETLHCFTVPHGMRQTDSCSSIYALLTPCPLHKQEGRSLPAHTLQSPAAVQLNKTLPYYTGKRDQLSPLAAGACRGGWPSNNACTSNNYTHQKHYLKIISTSSPLSPVAAGACRAGWPCPRAQHKVGNATHTQARPLGEGMRSSSGTRHHNRHTG